MVDKILKFNDLNGWLRSVFGQRVQKVTVDAGLTCPNRDGSISKGGCIFCNPKGSGSGAYSKGISITKQIENGKKYLSRRYKANMFLAYFQAFTNTYASVEILKQLYDEALSVDGVVGLSIGTRPDCVDDSILELLGHYTKKHLIWVEYGMQSIHNQTLKLVNRGHDFECFQKVAKATQKCGVKVCAHVILGLPGETKQMMYDTANKLADLRIDGVKIHLLYVIKGTVLENMYHNKKYICLEQNEYVELVCDFLELLPSDTVIHRITGDPHLDELVAPLWAVDKNGTRNMINNLLEVRKSCQGFRYRPSYRPSHK